MMSAHIDVDVDADRVFTRIKNILRVSGMQHDADDLDLAHLEFRELKRFRDEMTEEGRLAAQPPSVPRKRSLKLILGGRA